ncbi:hypothetical protein DW982_10940 [Phocaeicola plebeius]|nr:hypothetical protein DW982_10940 [Phocaeicola plebeius]
MFLLFFYARKYTRKNVFEPGKKRKEFQLKRKYVLVKTQVRLTPNVRAFYFKRKCVFRRHKNELTFE